MSVVLIGFMKCMFVIVVLSFLVVVSDGVIIVLNVRIVMCLFFGCDVW